MFIIRYRTVFVAISVALIVLCIGALSVLGLKPSIDFTGGTLLEISRGQTSPQTIQDLIEGVGGTSVSVRPTEDAFLVRSASLTPEQIASVEERAASLSEGVSLIRASTIGPSLGEELFRKALIALALVSLGILVFVAIAFWKVSKPVSSWVYGLVTLGTLAHDILIPAGVFAILGHFAGVEVDALFIVALLTILGYSVNDTIVVFDRVRENIRVNQEANKREDFELTVGRSLTQTYARSLNTSLTTMLVLLALFFFGGAATEDFALALLLGVAAGAYSSIFFAAPLLVIIEKMGKKQKA